MVSTVDQTFITEFNSDLVHLYANKGYTYKGLTREGMVTGSTVRWQRIGSLTAQAMPTRHDEHTFIDLTHDFVEATMVDSVVPTFLRDLDQMKANVNIRQGHAARHLEAMGRKFDADVRAAIVADASSEIGPGDAVALTVDDMIDVLTAFNEADAPDDGRRYCAVSPRTWGRMLKIDQFSNADYVGSADLPFGGRPMTAKMWGGVLWFMDSLIAVNGTTNVATNLVWHADSVGHGINAQPETKLDWENTRSAWSIVTTQSTGVKTVEPAGTFTWSVDELA